MKKIIRLTESELKSIINKVINEASTSLARPGAAPAAPAAPTLSAARPEINFPDIPEKKTPPPKTIFGVGDKGSKVLDFQKDLAALGYNVGSSKKMAQGAGGIKYGPPDGIFGPNTEAAVKDFQSKNGIKVSGRVGPPTMRKLKSAVESKRVAGQSPSAEWNVDRASTGQPQQSTQPTTPPKTSQQKKSKISPLITTSPLGQAIGKAGEKARASIEARKKGMVDYQKTHPSTGYGGGRLFGNK